MGDTESRGKARLRRMTVAASAISIGIIGCSASPSSGNAGPAGHPVTTSRPPASSPQFTGPVTGTLIGALRNPSFSSYSVAFNTGGNLLAVGTGPSAVNTTGGDAYLWDFG